MSGPDFRGYPSIPSLRNLPHVDDEVSQIVSFLGPETPRESFLFLANEGLLLSQAHTVSIASTTKTLVIYARSMEHEDDHPELFAKITARLKLLYAPSEETAHWWFLLFLCACPLPKLREFALARLGHHATNGQPSLTVFQVMLPAISEFMIVLDEQNSMDHYLISHLFRLALGLAYRSGTLSNLLMPASALDFEHEFSKGARGRWLSILGKCFALYSLYIFPPFLRELRTHKVTQQHPSEVLLLIRAASVSDCENRFPNANSESYPGSPNGVEEMYPGRDLHIDEPPYLREELFYTVLEALERLDKMRDERADVVQYALLLLQEESFQDWMIGSERNQLPIAKPPASALVGLFLLSVLVQYTEKWTGSHDPTLQQLLCSCFGRAKRSLDGNTSWFQVRNLAQMARICIQLVIENRDQSDDIEDLLSLMLTAVLTNESLANEFFTHDTPHPEVFSQLLMILDREMNSLDNRFKKLSLAQLPSWTRSIASRNLLTRDHCVVICSIHQQLDQRWNHGTNGPWIESIAFSGRAMQYALLYVLKESGILTEPAILKDLADAETFGDCPSGSLSELYRTVPETVRPGLESANVIALCFQGARLYQGEYSNYWFPMLLAPLYSQDPRRVQASLRALKELVQPSLMTWTQALRAYPSTTIVNETAVTVAILLDKYVLAGRLVELVRKRHIGPAIMPCLIELANVLFEFTIYLGDETPSRAQYAMVRLAIFMLPLLEPDTHPHYHATVLVHNKLGATASLVAPLIGEAPFLPQDLHSKIWDLLAPPHEYQNQLDAL